MSLIYRSLMDWREEGVLAFPKVHFIYRKRNREHEDNEDYVIHYIHAQFTG